MQEGDQYQNTTDHARYTHNGTAWVSDIERIEDLEGLVGTGGRWCGASATAPSTRLDGSPLQEGDEYQNTTGSHLRYNWTGSAWVALNSSAQTLEAELSGADGAEKIVYTRPISGGIARTLEAKLAEDFPTVKDAGAKGDTTTNNSAAIESTMVAGNVHFPTGNFYSISESIKYRSERFVKGEFYGFSGTVLKPTGDFPTFVGTPSTGNYSRVAIRDFQINGENNATCYSIKLHDCFLMELDRIWLRSSFHGVDLQRSNSIVLKDFKVMETPRGDSVNILNCTSIKFISSNFETSVAGQRQTGIFRITSDLGSIANAELHGCQFERTGLKVGAASVKSFGGVLSDCDIDMLDESRSCFVDMEMSGSAMVHDFGMNNVVKNAYCQNMATPQHEWPKLQQATPSTSLTFGAVGEEWVYLVSAGSRSNAALSSGLIEIKDGSTVLASSGAFSFPAYGNSQGLTPRRAKSFLAVVKNPAGASGPIFTNCAGFSLKGGKNLLSNGTFAGGATTGWTLSGVTASASGDDVLLTPSASNWTILQNIDALAKQGKRYILVAKFSGAASLTYGNAMDGSAGARPLADSGVPNLYGDGDTVAMLSFEHYRSLAANISLGRVGSNTPVTVRWIALIEVPN